MTRPVAPENRVRKWRDARCFAPGCGRTFKARHEAARHCSPACRKRASRRGREAMSQLQSPATGVVLAPTTHQPTPCRPNDGLRWVDSLGLRASRSGRHSEPAALARMNEPAAGATPGRSPSDRLERGGYSLDRFDAYLGDDQLVTSRNSHCSMARAGCSAGGRSRDASERSAVTARITTASRRAPSRRVPPYRPYEETRAGLLFTVCSGSARHERAPGPDQPIARHM
jgi:hypothetical protein